jgi:6-phosphogluconolactonase (cycloisomerase 2 family)
VTTIRVNCVTNTYAVRVNVSGMNPLSASSGAPGNLVLQNNGGNNLTLNTNGLFTFTTAVASGTPYGVTVFTQPSYPAQTCTVQAPSSGTIVNAPVTVNVNCTTNLYTVGGTVSGLSGSGFVLRNGTTPVALSGSTFSISLPSAASYSFNVGTQPTNPSQTCVVSANGSGTVASNNVGDISVTCTTNVYPIGGNVTGLQPGTSFTLTKNGTQQIVISANGMYEFAQGLLSGTTYGVVITKKALGQTCTVTNGSGTVTTGPITNVNVDCVVSNIPRFAFVLHSGDDSLATFAIDAQTGGAKYISKAKTGPAPTSVAVNPDARAVYVTNQKDGTVSQFRVGVSGNLTELTAPEKAGSLPASIVVEPWYRFAYVIGYGGTVSQFSIGTKGDLTPIGSPISTGGTAAIDGAVDPDGRYLYVVNRNNANVAQFRINTNGTLSTIAAPVAAGTAPQRVVVDGSGRYVYVANDTTRDISAYVIGANGALTSLDCSAFKGVACAADPTNFAAAQNPLALAADPAGTYLYLNTNLSSTATGEGVGVIYRYTIGTSGELVGSAFGLTGNSNTSLAVDPSGRYAYVGNQYSDDIYQIKLTPAAAAPTVLPAINPNFVATQDSPVAIAIYSGSAAVEPMAKIVYASNYGTSAIAQYAAAPDGRLSALTPATTGATTPAGIAIDPTGRFAYSVRLETGGKVPGAVSQFAIDANGLLSPITGAVSPSTGLLAYFIGMHPSGRYAYVPDSGSNTISQFTIGENGVLAPLGTAKAATGSGPIGIAVHPSGRYVYVTNSTPGQAAPVTSVGQYLVSAQDGSLSNIGAGAVTAGDRATGIAVTPDGRFAYVTNYNSTNSQIYQFSIGSDGSLSPLAVASVASGANPYAIAVDPTGSYVYAVNVGADGTISQYRIGADGGLVPMTPLTVSVGAYPTGITVDATGTYVYITGYGAGFTNPFVGQLQITTDGSLAPLSPSSVTTGSLPISVTTTATYQ